MSHDVQDGRDAGSRARATSRPRPRPIRYDLDTWLVMRNDPVLPAAVIMRLRGPKAQEFFVVIRWGLDPGERRMVGRYPTLDEADFAVLWSHPSPIVPAPNEDEKALRKRQEWQALELERQQREREALYGP